jgi:hypothetical protein
MAYKNQKKNKRHTQSLRKKHGDNRRKRERELTRRNPYRATTQEELESLMRKAGMM